MNDQDKQRLKQRYQEEKERGVKFFPDIIYKDTIVAFAIFILLIGLAAFVGVSQEPPADPSDTTYIPRPEWYFLFLFELLKYFPGQIEFIGTVIIPGAAILALLLLPFLDRRLQRHPFNRPLATAVMTAILVLMAGLTLQAALTTPEQPEAAGQTFAERVAAGQDLYSLYCTECHGPEGEGGEIKGVEGLEGTFMKPIRSRDVLYTRTDETLYNVLEYGQPSFGMPAFGMANGGELNRQQLEAIVAFVRSWDDRVVVELPKAVIPELAAGEIPDYETHVQPIFKRYCISCHREGNAKQNYLMTSYQNVMESGDHAPNVVGGDLNSNMLRMLNREKIDAGGPMPPSRALDLKYVDIIRRWIEAGALPVRPAVTPTLAATEAISGTPEAPISPLGTPELATATLTITPSETAITGTLPLSPAVLEVTAAVFTPGLQGVSGTLTAPVTPETVVTGTQGP